ncbi:adoMet-dependent rRNA methyltransferase spb1 [Dioscorea cayenensis subsp. rotundata]|uniref:Putative rRNA methyltransferase n=1 Tax=Dioscorea cayennensis subsp. rotundata TaxID=55577 RepID=A0AB40ALZ9_DIOCR|nr:adoMet-dependent rRNA methyltransferase spb1 [Dioscorea cayenensis subsp. rotundata]
MGKAKTKGKQRLDKFYHLAKEQGYRSRAAFKLHQLDAKYSLLSSSRSVLDLCAAPGGWLQVAVRRAPVGAFILGVDLHPIRPIKGAESIVEDITTPRCRSTIKRLMGQHGVSAFNLVLHDGSPNVGGAWAQEATSQSALVVDSIRLATEFLAPQGTFVTKVFRSQDYSAIIYCMKQLFEKVEVTKPVASRSTSAEIYVIGLKYKAPAKIDPRLLDVKHLFQGVTDTPKVVDVLRGTKQKRNREGYEDGSSILRKVGKASDFIWSETPLEFLGSVTELSFVDPACLSIKNHELTSEEVRSLCADLCVLDKHSFKHLLKWRMRIRKELLSSKKVASKAAETENGTKCNVDEDDVKGNEDDRLLGEMEELTFALEHKKKRQKKLLAKRRAKDKVRKATGMQVDATEDSYNDNSLFSLSSIKGKKELSAIHTAELNHEDGEFTDSENEEMRAAVYHDTVDSPGDSDEDQKRYDEQLEEMLDQAYERYITRKGGSTKPTKRAKRVASTDGADLMEGGDDDDVAPSDYDSDHDENGQEMNPLMVSLHEDEPATQEQIMDKWFSQDVFARAATQGEFEKSDSDDEGEEHLPRMSKKIKDKAAGGKGLTKPKSRVSQQEDFEIVPAEPIKASDDDDDSSSDTSEDLDDLEKAEISALGVKMLRKKLRNQIIDDGYSRYMFDDDEDQLPLWFVQEEKKHSQPMKPVTREEVAAMRAQFREIDARPAKKVAEAKARKKRIAMKKMENARQKANAISDQTDISERSKDKMINQLYKKAMPKRPQKEYVVAKKGVQVKPGKGKVLVDRRMKKDARSRGAGKSGKGKKMKGGAKGKVKGQRNRGASKAPSKGNKGGRKGMKA